MSSILGSHVGFITRDNEIILSERQEIGLGTPE